MRIFPLKGGPGAPPRGIAEKKVVPEVKARTMRVPQKWDLETISRKKGKMADEIQGKKRVLIELSFL